MASEFEELLTASLQSLESNREPKSSDSNQKLPRVDQDKVLTSFIREITSLPVLANHAKIPFCNGGTALYDGYVPQSDETGGTVYLAKGKCTSCNKPVQISSNNISRGWRSGGV